MSCRKVGIPEGCLCFIDGALRMYTWRTFRTLHHGKQIAILIRISLMSPAFIYVCLKAANSLLNMILNLFKRVQTCQMSGLNLLGFCVGWNNYLALLK